MPNWCDNILTISHKEAHLIRRAAEAYNEERLLFFLYPVKNIENVPRKWLNENWGTRSDISNNGIKTNVEEAYLRGSLTVRFDTAWSPPIGVYEKAEAAGFVVRALYYEEGASYAGIWENGNDHFYDLDDYNLDELRNEIPKDLDKYFGILDRLSMSEDDEE